MGRDKDRVRDRGQGIGIRTNIKGILPRSWSVMGMRQINPFIICHTHMRLAIGVGRRI